MSPLDFGVVEIGGGGNMLYFVAQIFTATHTRVNQMRS